MKCVAGINLPTWTDIFWRYSHIYLWCILRLVYNDMAIAYRFLPKPIPKSAVNLVSFIPRALRQIQCTCNVSQFLAFTKNQQVQFLFTTQDTLIVITTYCLPRDDWHIKSWWGWWGWRCSGIVKVKVQNILHISLLNGYDKRFKWVKNICNKSLAQATRRSRTCTQHKLQLSRRPREKSGQQKF